MGVPPISFTGFSQFSEEFQVVLERSFEAASLPVQNLQTDQALILSQQEALGGLANTFQSLESAFTDLGLLGANSAVSASSSDEEVATVTATGSSETGVFDVVVDSAATAAQEASLTGLSDKNQTGLTADGIYKLTLGATTTDIDLLTKGAGRTAGSTGSSTPSPKVSVEVDFSEGLSGSITAELESFFVAPEAPSSLGSGDTIEVNFVSSDQTINETIVTDALTGSETTADLATLLNNAIAANAELNGKLSFSDEGGKLKLVVDDSAGQGFSFTSSSTGTTVSGLEGGGVVGGHSAEEIAAALNAQVALDPTLEQAGVAFSAEDGEVKVTGDTKFDITVTDNAQGTGFVSGLAGTHTVEGFDNTLEGLRDFINSQSASLGVEASIINVSSDPDQPKFHLNLIAKQTGTTTLRLQDSASADLLTETLIDGQQGTDAVFTVNGLEVTNSGNTISDFLPGLTLNIVGPGSATVNIDTDRSEISNALAEIATQYNEAVGKIQEQVGENAGPLSGHIVVRLAQQTLREITSFFLTEGEINSMAALGLELDDSGLLSVNSITLNALTDEQLQEAIAFIGDTSSGFAGNGRTLLQSLADPTTGQIQTTIDLLVESDEQLAKQIEEAQDQVDQLIARLERQFAEADVLLARLESQQDLLTEIFSAFNRSQEQG